VADAAGAADTAGAAEAPWLAALAALLGALVALPEHAAKTRDTAARMNGHARRGRCIVALQCVPHPPPSSAGLEMLRP